jgi:hypothetical protein
MVDRVKHKIEKAEAGSDPYELAKLVFAAMDKHGIGMAPALEKDAKYQKLVKKLDKQLNIVSSEEAAKAIRVFKIKVYEINSTRIMGRSVLDSPPEYAPMAGILDMYRRMGIADDEIGKYKTPVIAALNKLRKELEQNDTTTKDAPLVGSNFALKVLGI